MDASLPKQRDYGSEARKAALSVGKSVSDLGARFGKTLLKTAFDGAEKAYDSAVSYSKPGTTHNEEYGPELTVLAKKTPKNKKWRSLSLGNGSANHFEYERRRDVQSPNRAHRLGTRHTQQNRQSSYGLGG